MPSLRIAHIREQEQNIVIVSLDSSFGGKSAAEQHEVVAEIQMRSHAAGLAGKAVPVWESGTAMYFIAPPQWSSYFKSLNMSVIWSRVNRELSW